MGAGAVSSLDPGRLSEAELRNLSRAREIIAQWIAHDNERRLHAALHYLLPAEYYRGDFAARGTAHQPA